MSKILDLEKELERKLLERFPDLDYLSLWEGTSKLDGDFTAEQLRAIADAVDEVSRFVAELGEEAYK
jgi:hypothetical protein